MLNKTDHFAEDLNESRRNIITLAESISDPITAGQLLDNILRYCIWIKNAEDFTAESIREAVDIDPYLQAALYKCLEIMGLPQTHPDFDNLFRKFITIKSRPRYDFESRREIKFPYPEFINEWYTLFEILDSNESELNSEINDNLSDFFARGLSLNEFLDACMDPRYMLTLGELRTRASDVFGPNGLNWLTTEQCTLVEKGFDQKRYLRKTLLESLYEVVSDSNTLDEILHLSDEKALEMIFEYLRHKAGTITKQLSRLTGMKSPLVTSPRQKEIENSINGKLGGIRSSIESILSNSQIATPNDISQLSQPLNELNHSLLPDFIGSCLTTLRELKNKYTYTIIGKDVPLFGELNYLESVIRFYSSITNLDYKNFDSRAYNGVQGRNVGESLGAFISHEYTGKDIGKLLKQAQTLAIHTATFLQTKEKFMPQIEKLIGLAYAFMSLSEKEQSSMSLQIETEQPEA